MAPKNPNRALVRALSEVPEKRLRLVELAWELCDKRGRIDFEKARLLSRQLEEAVREAESYAASVRDIMRCLSRA